MVDIRKLDTLAEKQVCWPLLLLADPDKDMVMKYLGRGDMYVLYQGGEAVSEAVVAQRDDGELELMNLATDEQYQRRGYAGMLIEHIISTYRGRYERLYVGTAFPGIYERWGFERVYTVPNFFIDNYPELVYDEGRLCVDMIYYVRSI